MLNSLDKIRLNQASQLFKESPEFLNEEVDLNIP